MSDISGSFKRQSSTSGGSIFLDEQTTNIATGTIGDVYRPDAIAVGDFSSKDITAAGFHYYGDGDDAVILEGTIGETSPEIVFINPDNSGNCVQTTITNRDNTQLVIENSANTTLFRIDCNGDGWFESGSFHIGDALNPAVIISDADSVTSTPDILMSDQGLISAESNLFLKSETGVFSFRTGGAGSGTTGTTEVARIDQTGDFQFDSHLYQGVGINTAVPASYCIDGGTTTNYFNNRVYIEENLLLEEGLFAEYTSSQGGEGVWCVRPNDGSGNWHMYWNTTGTTSPTRCADGIAFEWEINDFSTNDSLVLKSADIGNAGTAITWQPAIYIRPSTTATGAVGIKRSPTTYDFELSGRAAKTTTGQWIIISDRRLKEDIQDFELGLDSIVSLQPRTFKMKDGDGSTNVGWIAQEVDSTDFSEYMVTTWMAEETVDLPDNAEGKPNVITKEYLALDEAALIPAMVNAIKELTARIEELENPSNQSSSGGRRVRTGRQIF